MKRMILMLVLIFSLALGGQALAGRTAGGDSFPGGSDLPGDGGGAGGDGGSATATVTVNPTNQQQQGQIQGQMQGQLQGQIQGIEFHGGRNNGTAESDAASQSFSEGGKASATGGNSASYSSAGAASASADNQLSLVFEDQRDFAPTLQAYGVGAGQVRYGPNAMDKTRGYVPLKKFMQLRPNVTLPEGVVQNHNINRDITFFEDNDVSNYPDTVTLLEEANGPAVAIGTIWSDKDESNTTAALVYEAARYCSRMNAMYLVPIRQNATSEAVSSGWGIGLSYNMAGMTNGGDISQVGAGGTGYSRAKGGHRYRLGLEFACVR